VTSSQPQPAPPSNAAARYRWAQLLSRVFAIDLTRCQRPGCAGTTKVIAQVTNPDVIAKILTHLGLADSPAPIASPAPMAAARAPPWHGILEAPPAFWPDAP